MYLRIIYGASKVKNLFYRIIKYAYSNYVSNSKEGKFIIKYRFFIKNKIVS